MLEDPVFEPSGAALCLDFANRWSGRPDPSDRGLGGYLDLVAWGRAAGVLGEAEADALSRAAGRRPADAGAVVRRAIALRGSIARTLARLAAGEAPDGRDLAALNQALPEALAHLRLDTDGRRWRWRWQTSGRALDRILWPVVRSAADLLTSNEVDRVRECAAEGCGWLFLDRSRNRRRKWCDMTTCGNRAKARRYYERHRAADRTEGNR